MRKVLQYLRPQFNRMGLQLMIKLSATVVELFLPRMLSVILDKYAAAGDLGGVWRMGGVMLLCAALAWLGNVVANVMATTISCRFIIDMRRDLFARVSRLSAAQRNELTEASILSRLTSDSYNVHNMVDRLQRLGVRAPILLLGGIIVSLTMEPVLTLVLVCSLPLLGFIVVYTSRKGVPLFTRVQEGQDRMVRKIQENMTGSRIIRALSCVDREQDSFNEVNEELAARQKTADLTMAAVGPLTSLVLNTGLAVVVLVGAWRVAYAGTKPGAIIAFLNYFTIILNALLMVSRMFVMYSKGSASARRIQRVMDMPMELEQTADAGETAGDSDVHIAFRDVSFSYNKRTPNVEHISFELRHGQTMGIIGPTGSGKTTLLSLIMRMYDADEGQILLEGKPIAALSEEELHSRLGVVFQNDFLMADTIRENIRFGRDVPDEAIMEALDCAQGGFVAEKEGGLDHELNVKGRNISGGQQQRIFVARALADDPRLLLLDDCSSALDYRTDRALRHALRERHGQATTILVAQRVSAVMAADLILVMDGGRIIASGTHAELFEHCGMYRELCMLQLGGASA